MTTHSGDTSPGGSNSLSNSSVRTRTSEDSQIAPHKSFHLDCYNSSPEQDDESEDHYDDEALSHLMLNADLFRRRTSVGVQTDYNEDFPPLKFLRAFGEDSTGLFGQTPFFFNNSGVGSEVPPQNIPSQLPIPTLSAAVGTTATLTANANSADASSSSTDGTLQLVIQNFRHMSDTVRGPCKYIQGVPWRIMVMPRQHVVQKKGTQKCLGFFLQCCPDAYSESWSCQASAELRLISQQPGVNNFSRKTNHTYTAKENDWGYSCFMTWTDILDEKQGFIKDDKVTLEVHVKADPPKNILTHTEFKKKIQDYKRLADMQCQRGFIDKAIECNTQALKFCKDKDSQCKAELEAQKAHLIEMKLKQSIQRIEKGSDGSTVEDEATKLNALRQAMGTTTRNNNNNTAKVTKNKSTSTKDSANNVAAAVNEKQQQQRAGTPPYTTQNSLEQKQQIEITTEEKYQLQSKQTQKTKSVEPQGIRTSSDSAKTTENFAAKMDDISQSKKRLYKSVSTNEIFCAAGTKCKDELDYTKDQYQEEEELLPDQIQHFLKHLSEGDKSSTRLKEQITKLELIASPFEKSDPFLEELLKLDPKETDKALVKAITFAALERENERERERFNNPKVLKKVLQDKYCDSCLRGGHIQIEKRETSEFGCQTEFTRRIPREALTADDQAFHMMQQYHHQQQQMVGQVAEDYLNVLNNQTFATQQLQNNQAAIHVPALPTRRKKATAKKNLQQQTQQNQQQNLQQQNIHAHNRFQQFFPRGNSQMNLDNSQSAGIDVMGLELNDPRMDLFAATAKPLIGTQGIDMNLTALAANLDLSKIQFAGDPTLTDANQHANANVFSRQYIEEWLRYSTRNLLKPNFNLNENKHQQQQSTTASTATMAPQQAAVITDDPSGTNQLHFNEATAALGVIQLNCLNARNIQQKVAEFVEQLESHPNIRELRNSIDRLLALSADDENFTNTEDTISVVSVSECSGNVDLTNESLHDYSSTFQRSFIEDDPHDYMLLRELRQAEIVLNSRLQTIMSYLHKHSVSDVVERLESKMKLYSEKLKKSAGECLAMKANEKKTVDQLSLAQKEFQNLNGKYEKLIQQLKERKNEIKKLEKKAKSEAQLASENIELQEKLDSMKKEFTQVQRQLTEEQAKYRRDTQSLADSKKHLNVELNSKYSEVQKLSTQLEEKTQALKKAETQLANERKNSSQTVANLTERVRRAEVNLLEHKLEDGLRVLERAKDDCALQIKALEEMLHKRTLPVEQDVIKKNIVEWENKREEVVALINQAKTDFYGHIQSVKSGKQLSQLPKIQVPKPPPCPKLFPIPQPQIQPLQSLVQPQVVPPSPLPLERKVITPPSRRPGAITPQQHIHQQAQSSTQVHMSPGCHTSQFQHVPGMVVGGTPSVPSSANATPVKGHFQQLQQQSIVSQPPPLSNQVPPPSIAIAPIGVRPHNYQNGISVPPPSTASHVHHNKMPPQQQIQHRHSPQQTMHFQPVGASSQHSHQQLGAGTATGSNNSFQTWSGAGWGDQLNNISELFGQGRSFGPLGSDFGGGSGSVVGVGAMRSASVTGVGQQPGVIGAPPPSSQGNPSSQPIGAGRNVQNVSPSQSQNQQQQQQQQHRNGWSSFTADTWSLQLSGRQN